MYYLAYGKHVVYFSYNIISNHSIRTAASTITSEFCIYGIHLAFLKFVIAFQYYSNISLI